MPTLLSGPEEEVRECNTASGAVDTIRANGAASTLRPGGVTTRTGQTRAGCPKCGSQESWGAASWCPACGFYPAFDKLEPGTEPVAVTSNEDSGPQSAWQAIPGWIWVMGLGCAAIFIATIAAELLMEPHSPPLVLWTLAQTLIGGVVTLSVHVAAYTLAIQKSATYSGLDLIIKPVEIWRPTLARLPQTRRRVCLLAWGLTALFGSFFVLSGWDVHALFREDWAEAGPEKNLLHQIVQNAKAEREGEESLEDAMNKFVGDEPPVAEVPKIVTDCLILGFVKPDRGEGFESILLAAIPPPGSKLSFCGTMTAEQISPDIRQVLIERMPSLVRRTPFVRAPYDAVWLRPVLMCRIEHQSWTAGKHLHAPKFQKMLRDVNAEE